MQTIYKKEGLKMSVFSVRLKSLRKEKGATQNDIAELLGVTRQGYAKYENGNGEPDLTAINKLATYFDVTTDYLLGQSDFRDYTASDQEDLLRFKDDPALQRWFYELPKSPEEDLRKLKKMWDYLKDDK